MIKNNNLSRAQKQLHDFLQDNRRQCFKGIDRSAEAIAERLRIAGWINGNNALEGESHPECGSFLHSLQQYYVDGDISSEQAEKVVEIAIRLQQ